MKRTPLPILIVWLWLSSLCVMGVANAATPLLTSPTAGTTFSGNSQTFTWDAQGNTVTNWTLYLGSTLGKYDYYKSATLAGTVTSLTASNLPVNAHKVYARLRYKIGTVWAFQDFTYYAHGTNHKPSITGTPATLATVGSAYIFTPIASDVDGETVTFSILNKPSWATFNAKTGKLTGTPTTAGTASNISISVKDERSAVTTLTAFSIQVAAANRLPVISGTPLTSANVGTAYSFTPTASDADNDTLTFSVTNPPAWATFSTTTGKLSGTPTAVGTTTGVVISVTDGKSAPVSLPAFNLQVIQPNRAPTLSGTPATAVNVNEAYSFTPTASDADNDTLTFSVTNPPAWATFSTTTGKLSGTPTAAGTTTGVVISVTDGKSAPVSLPAFNIQVIQPNRAPTLSGTPATAVNVSETYSFTPTASDADNDTLTFSITNPPAWATFDTATGKLSGTPTAAGTTTGIVISVTDGKSAPVSLPAFNIQVIQPNRAPTLSGTPATAVNVSETYSFTPTASDADNDTLTFSVTNPPAWATFSTTTGKLSGTPTAAGTTTGVVISVTDGKSAPVSLPAFNIQVIQPNRAPTLSGTPATAVNVSEAYSFTPTASDADNDTLTFSITNPPAWATFDTATGKLSGTPTTANIGTTSNIVISVTDGKSDPLSLPAFNLSVIAPINMARQFGIATQGKDYDSSSAASLAIDGNTTTFNHTTCDATNNWWQVKLPDSTAISKIVITSRSSWTSRIKDAAVYVNTAAYSGTLSDANKVATLIDTAAAQTTTFTTPKAGAYVLVKASGTNCLHMAEVEVYGQAQAAPVFSQTAYAFNLSEKAVQGAVVGTAKAVDYQLNPLSYSLVGTVPFAIDAQGQITLTGTLNHNLLRTYSFTAKVSDGVNTTSVPVTVNLGKGTGVYLQRWEGVSGSTIASLTSASHYLNDAPDYTATLSTFTATDSGKSNFGQRLSGVIVPTQSGRYQFAIVGDDATQLRLSSNAVLDGAPIVASTSSWANFQDWANAGVSGWITLEAGKVYALEALHKENSGGDHVSVAWKREGDSSFSTLPTAQLSQDALSAGAVKPVFGTHSTSFLIKASTPVGTKVTQVPAVDPQGDALTYTLAGSNLFSIDAQGNISIAGALQSGTTYTLTVTATDGYYPISDTITVKTTTDTAVQDAITTGDATNVTSEELVDAAIAQAQAQTDSCSSTLNTLYSSGLEATTFPSRSAYFNSSSARNIPFHAGVTSGAVRVYSWVGQKDAGTRYAVLGTNVFSFTTVNTETKNSTLNLFKWLLKQPNSTDILNQKLIVLVPNSGDRSALATWFTTNGLTHQWTISADTNLLNTGLFDLYLGDIANSTTLADVQKTFALGKPVLVFNNWYEPSATTLAAFELTWNWWGSGSVGNLASATEQCSKTSATGVIQTTLTSLKNGLPDFVYESSDCPVSDGGNTDCDVTKVTDSAGNSVATLFSDGASALRSQIRALDAKGINAFSLGSTENLLKLAILLGDKYRATVQFPMDKVTTDDTTFYRAQFADFAVHYSRPNNTYQPDMGKFTDAQEALNAQATTSQTVSFTPTEFDEWTSTGLYAPPGKTFTVRRTDSSTAVVKFKLNMLRDGSMHVWQTNDYNRPRFLASTELVLDAGKTYTLSTPRGGPVYAGWNAVASGATPFTLEISGVLENPLLKAFDDASIQTFLNQVEASNSDWVDIKTPYAEVHTLKAHMFTAFSKQDGNSSNGYTLTDVQNYIDDLNNYLIAGNYAYAGFTGTGLPSLNANVSNFCSNMGLSSVSYDGAVTNLCTNAKIHVKPKIQHINADVQANCGALCSGNPFDSGSPIMPLDWGENHEMGHNLQRARLNVYAGRSGETSNNIFPLHTQWAWTVAQGLTKHPSTTRPPHQSAFTMLQSAIAAGTPANISHPLWADGTNVYANAGERLSFYMQFAYSHQSWDLYTKLYLMERIFTDAIKTDAKWSAAKDLLGFSAYSRTDATAISGNDFLYIAASKIAGKDYSNYFAAWGIEVSAAAKAQTVANGFTDAIPSVFYYVNNELPAVMPTVADTIPLNGTSAWVDPTP